ncbi:YebC/PmpR family DNA-binding transcriptional regulator [Patescibacteria group bacterium]|nr:YebC/PmpR family DNA-binding transcriptional regulator [Patescibacteria group bacterium]
MSGHSKWSKIKHSKGAVDAKKSAMFTKFGHAITLAVREGGGDPEANFKLRLSMERAKKANMPRNNIDRAIKRGMGEVAGERIEEVIYEIFGPEGSVILIEALTDNKNRTVGGLRQIFNKYGGRLGEHNSVLRMFERKGIIRIVDFKSKISNLDDWQLKIIDLGAEDIKIEEDKLAIYINPEDLEKIKKEIEQEKVEIDYAEIEWFAKDLVKISESSRKKINAIFNELDNNSDINNYYTNIE